MRNEAVVRAPAFMDDSEWNRNDMEQERFGKCPFFTTQRLIQGKWAILIMHYLADGPVRFNELQRLMPKMTHATLSNQLKQLMEEGLVERTVLSDMPPVVEYSLTDMGRKFKPVLDSIREFGFQYIDYMGEKADAITDH